MLASRLSPLLDCLLPLLWQEVVSNFNPGRHGIAAVAKNTRIEPPFLLLTLEIVASMRSIGLRTLSDGYFPQRHPGLGYKEPARDAHCKAPYSIPAVPNTLTFAGRANGIGHWVSLSVRTCQRQRSILEPLLLCAQLLPVENPVHTIIVSTKTNIHKQLFIFLYLKKPIFADTRLYD